MKLAEIDNKKAFSLEVTGLIQGVGFRPFVYNLAKLFQLNGKVRNTNMNVEIIIEGEKSQAEKFILELKAKQPVAADIKNISVKEIAINNYTDFEIQTSQNLSDNITQVSPDIAVCDKCLDDLRNQSHRISYPFVNCTNCGPRFTIIKSLPYDRPNTTMDVFEMCETCSEEYHKITDRRFHAQPISCNSCGPKYRLLEDKNVFLEFDKILEKTKIILNNEGVIAIKGMGGFHLMCNAKSEKAVNKTRKIKKRDKKPFAVLFKDLNCIKAYCNVNKEETELLTSRKRPVVILDSFNNLAQGISEELNTIGALLPYMPMHHLLFEDLDTNALVLTSANLSGNPILIDNNITAELLIKEVDAILDYDRDIHNRTDDSVCQTAGNEQQILRRSRGFAPQPIYVDFPVEGIFASGAELVNCFCIGKGNQAILSQHIGDLKNYETYQFYEETFNRFQSLFKFKPQLVVHDLHPDYLSTRFALELPLKQIAVQHHHAHIAAVMTEHNINEKVIGVCLDGTGYGTDEKIWGGEFFTCDFIDCYRKSHFEYIDLPGGDKATEEPWRMAASYLKEIYGNDWINLDIPLVKELKVEIPQFSIFSKILSVRNHIKTSSAGRLFDAVAALTGICKYSAFHSQAPMLLQNSATIDVKEIYNFKTGESLSFLPAIEEIIHDIQNKTDIHIIASRFHNTIAEAISEQVTIIHNSSGINKVVLSGGCFQNKILYIKLKSKLQNKGFQIYSGNNIPVNDGGIALGQLAIAAHKLNNGLIN